MLLLLTTFSLIGCVTPSCDEVCTKVMNCDLSPRVSEYECVTSCTSQKQLYEDWDDVEKQDLFDAHRRCLGSSTCEEIDEGFCYEDDLFVF